MQPPPAQRSPTLSIAGPSGSGKTTLLERLIATLRASSLSVFAVKHSHHAAPHLDQRGADTERFLDAGADGVAWVGRDLHFVIDRRNRVPTFSELLAKLPPSDLVLVEGWSAAHLQTIELIGTDGTRIDADRGGERIALVGTENVATELPFFHRDDVARLARFVAEWARR